MKKISPILQMNQTECGLCVATMLMDYYGVKINIHDISTKFVVGRDGSSVKNLKSIFAYYQFKTNIYEVRNKLSEIREAALPCIAYKKQGHFVVIESIASNDVTVLDPSIGRVKVSKEDLDNDYKNIIIKIQPSENFVKVNTRRNEFEIIWQALSSDKLLVIKVLVSAILVYITTLSIPILLKYIVDIYLDSLILNNQIKILSLIIISSSLVYLVVNRIKLTVSVNMSITIDKFLTNKVINKLFKNKFEYFLNRTSSDIQYRLALLKSLKMIISNVIIQTILDFGSMILIFLYILSIHINYAALLFFFTLLVLAFSFLVRDKMLLYKNIELSNDNKLQILQYDIFRSIFDVKVLGLSKAKQQVWNSYYDEYIVSHKRSQLYISNYHNLLSYITLYVPIFIPLLGIWISGLANSDEIGTIILLQSMTGIYINGLVSISQLSDNITTMKSYITRIQDVLLQEDEKERTNTIVFKGNIDIQNLSFTYPGAKEKVLNDISFTVKEGESIAIVGESGSGKSTLFYILLGAFDNYEGKIKFEGVDLDKLNKDKLREQVGVVPQNSLLFSGSIKENLTQDENYNDNDIYEVLKKVSLFDFVKSLSMGINTIISENGFNLSGGQKQRLALARAIISKKDVLFLDEATSSLDNITEHTVVNYLSKVSQTKIVIAHRLGTIKNSDRIVVMKNGRIIEVGSHKKLIEEKGEYYRMYFEDVQNG